MTLLDVVMHDLPVHPTSGLRAIGVLPSGKVIWPVMGAEDNPPPPPPAPTPPPAAPPTGYHSQEELNRIAAAEKAQGERAGRRKLLEELGLDPETAKPEDIKARLAEDDERRKAAESEAERKGREADEAKAKADRETATTTADRLAVRKERALLLAGLQIRDGEDRANDLARLADAVKLLEFAPDATDEQVTAAVNGLKTRIPGLFTAAAPGAPGAPSSLPGPGQPPATPPPGADAFEKGKARALALSGTPAAK